MKEEFNELTSWVERLGNDNPTFELHKLLREGTITYREFLKKMAEVSNHFCENLGFIPNEGLINVLHAKIYEEALSVGTSQAVQRLSDGVPSIPTIAVSAADEDDFI